jgi:hypothetical protein
MPRREASPQPLLRETATLAPPELRWKDESDPWRRSVELIQRARLTLDVASADLQASEESLGPFHPTSWYFRNALNEARLAWERLRAEVGTKQLDAAIKEPPITILTLGSADDEASPEQATTIILIPIGGQSYRVQRVIGTEDAPVQWRLTRLHPPLEDGPYFACRLADGSTQCDCADWTYQDAPSGRVSPCKHLRALAALGWI